MTGESAFTDVASDAYYEDAVVWAVENEITDGVNETSFAPAQSCTRAQIVTRSCPALAKVTVLFLNLREGDHPSQIRFMRAVT